MPHSICGICNSTSCRARWSELLLLSLHADVLYTAKHIWEFKYPAETLESHVAAERVLAHMAVRRVLPEDALPELLHEKVGN